MKTRSSVSGNLSSANSPQEPRLPSHPCGTCGGDMAFESDSGKVCCTAPQCAAAGILIPVWRAEQTRTGDPLAGGTPAGLPRPRAAGLPVPWITPVTGGHVWWRLIHGDRVRTCQERWLCQVCGLSLPDQAYVFATANRAVVSSSAVHKRCVDIAQRFCRAAAGFTVTPVTPGLILANGNPYHPGDRLPEYLPWTLA